MSCFASGSHAPGGSGGGGGGGSGGVTTGDATYARTPSPRTAGVIGQPSPSSPPPPWSDSVDAGSGKAGTNGGAASQAELLLRLLSKPGPPAPSSSLPPATAADTAVGDDGHARLAGLRIGDGGALWQRDSWPHALSAEAQHHYETTSGGRHVDTDVAASPSSLAPLPALHGGANGALNGSPDLLAYLRQAHLGTAINGAYPVPTTTTTAPLIDSWHQPPPSLPYPPPPPQQPLFQGGGLELLHLLQQAPQAKSSGDGHGSLWAMPSPTGVRPAPSGGFGPSLMLPAAAATGPYASHGSSSGPSAAPPPRLTAPPEPPTASGGVPEFLGRIWASQDVDAGGGSGSSSGAGLGASLLPAAQSAAPLAAPVLRVPSPSASSVQRLLANSIGSDTYGGSSLPPGDGSGGRAGLLPAARHGGRFAGGNAARYLPYPDAAASAGLPLQSYPAAGMGASKGLLLGAGSSGVGSRGWDSAVYAERLRGGQMAAAAAAGQEEAFQWQVDSARQMIGGEDRGDFYGAATGRREVPFWPDSAEFANNATVSGKLRYDGGGGGAARGRAGGRKGGSGNGGSVGPTLRRGQRAPPLPGAAFPGSGGAGGPWPSWEDELGAHPAAAAFHVPSHDAGAAARDREKRRRQLQPPQTWLGPPPEHAAVASAALAGRQPPLAAQMEHPGLPSSPLAGSGDGGPGGSQRGSHTKGEALVESALEEVNAEKEKDDACGFGSSPTALLQQRSSPTLERAGAGMRKPWDTGAAAGGGDGGGGGRERTLTEAREEDKRAVTAFLNAGRFEEITQEQLRPSASAASSPPSSRGSPSSKTSPGSSGNRLASQGRAAVISSPGKGGLVQHHQGRLLPLMQRQPPALLPVQGAGEGEDDAWPPLGRASDDSSGAAVTAWQQDNNQMVVTLPAATGPAASTNARRFEPPLLGPGQQLAGSSQRVRADMEDVTAALLAVYQLLIPGEEEHARRRMFLERLEALVLGDMPAARLFLFGSCANSFGVRNSDIDVCLAVGDGVAVGKAELVTRMAAILRAAGMQSALTHARVPIVKIVDPVTGLASDICVNNTLAVVNTKLLHDYARIDPRLRQLVFLVKHWAKQRQVNETYRGTLSSYAYVLMCIHFLQQRKPPILPCLQEMEVTYRVKVGDVECAYFDQVEALRDFGLGNRETVGELLLAFFEYWAFRHEYNRAVISVRTGGFLSKDQKDWTRRIGNERHLICVEDPFEVSHDLGRVVDRNSIRILREEFHRAAKLMRHDPSPAMSLFTRYVRDSGVP
eukprot:SM000122S25744  [mRNA]  locus=s122:16:4918:+ [translate_table: standard]